MNSSNSTKIILAKSYNHEVSVPQMEDIGLIVEKFLLDKCVNLMVLLINEISISEVLEYMIEYKYHSSQNITFSNIYTQVLIRSPDGDCSREFMAH